MKNTGHGYSGESGGIRGGPLWGSEVQAPAGGWWAAWSANHIWTPKRKLGFEGEIQDIQVFNTICWWVLYGKCFIVQWKCCEVVALGQSLYRKVMTSIRTKCLVWCTIHRWFASWTSRNYVFFLPRLFSMHRGLQHSGLSLLGQPLLTLRLIVVDNTLWYSRVLRPSHRHDTSTAAVVQFNEHVLQSGRWHVTMLPVRDGITILQRAQRLTKMWAQGSHRP